MAWTTPKTWASGYVVLAADLNTHLRDNLNVTAPAVLTTAGDILYASGANTPARLAKSTTSTQYLANTGTSNAPAWNEVALATGVSGTLPVGNGGTGATTFTANGILVGNSTSAVAVTATMATKGHLMAGDGSGVPSMLAVGTNDYVLTADSGEGTGIKWAAAGGGGALNVIGTVVASADATVGITGMTDTYEHYLCVITNMHPASDNVSAQFRLGDSGGIDSGSSDYYYHSSIAGTSPGYDSIATTSSSSIVLVANAGNANAEAVSAALWISRDDAGTFLPHVHGTYMAMTNGGDLAGAQVFGVRFAAIEVTQVQFSFSSGNVDTGRMTLYGVANS
jgi:hypothetical protein